MNFSKEKRKLENKIKKDSDKILNKMELQQFLSTMDLEIIGVDSKNKNIELLTMTDTMLKKIKRREIKNTLLAADYVKKSKKWTDHIVIGFLAEMYTLHIKQDVRTDEQNEEIKKVISKRYGVPVNRLNSTVALFLNTYKKGKGGVNIGEYFSDYELVLWQYEDQDKLQKALEKGSLTPKEETLIHELFNI